MLYKKELHEKELYKKKLHEKELHQKTILPVALTAAAALAGIALATLNYGPTASASNAATSVPGPIAMALTPSSPRITARTLTRTRAPAAAAHAASLGPAESVSEDLLQRIAALESQIESLLQAQDHRSAAAPISETVAVTSEDTAAELEQQSATGSALTERYFQRALDQHRAEAVDGSWATAQTLGIETLLASPTHSAFVNLDYLDCRASSCELSIQLSAAAPPHAEALLLGELGRELPTARIQRAGDQIVIVASRS